MYRLQYRVPVLFVAITVFFLTTSIEAILWRHRKNSNHGLHCRLHTGIATAEYLAHKVFHSGTNMAEIIQQVNANLTALQYNVNPTYSPLPTDDTQLADPEYIYRFLQYCALAYCDEQPAQGMSQVSGPGILVTGANLFLDYQTSDDVLYFIAAHPAQSTIVLAFRGSANPANWFQDAASWLSDADPSLFPYAPPHAKIHEGFQSVLKRLAPGIVSALNSIVSAYPGFNVVITGHSLGAVSILFMLGMLIALYRH